MLEFFEKKLKQVDNRARFLSGVLSGDIKIIPRKQKDLLQEIAEKGFDTLPKEVLPAAVGATIYREENGRSPDVHASDYDYLTSMTISALNEGYLEHLLELKKRFETKVGLLRRATPECLKSAKKRTQITLDIQLLDANYIKAQSDRKVVIVIDCKHNKVFEAAPRRQHKRTAAEYLEASVVLMDDDEDHLAGSLETQEFSETENTQKQQAKKQKKQRKKRGKEESKTGAISCRGLDCQGHDRSSHAFLNEEIKKIASGLDGVKITHGNMDRNRVAQVLAKLSLQDASVSA
ncbi:DNA topoisomerase 2-like isoform X1 [Triticum dicoccoides]|uniref:DNA topoisomerase 2-like isoform X1 n=1 Tax=Triticum dicoccoides TaxID=85692 RepID=UPI00188FE995|nr:DNA topoisomerase 2-like isoform X1 [Triticum dicoccoides]XP_044454056.1 DNA topoisomerase 2-like isoform X1 [Triticum aestivum]